MSEPPIHRRLGTRSRCIRCRMRLDLCLCPEITTLEAKTRFVLIMHAKEANKPTNTGFLVRAMLPSTEIRIRGRRDRIDLTDLSGAGLLFPLEDAEQLGPDAPQTILVPDGSWRQARNIVRRDLRTFRALVLPPGPPGELRIRKHKDPSCVSTLEAIARVLAIVESQELADRMLRVFRMMVDRTLWIRGQIATEDVYGGIAEEVLRMRGK